MLVLGHKSGGGAMRSIEDALKERETQAARLRDEIEKLREAIRIMEQAGGDSGAPSPAPVPVPSKRWP
jgi:hypothetical protein